MALSFLLLALVPAVFAQDYDLLIRNGRLADGTGNPSFLADLAIKDRHIAAIGKLSGKTARRTIDAAGLIVA
ncbi:MAG: D-aminoacylase, partial [Bryobacterales bacterium]|nr:D-aminoacylase [Bryobacterales bacterium]